MDARLLLVPFPVLFASAAIVRYRSYARALGSGTKKSHSYGVSTFDLLKLEESQVTRLSTASAFLLVVDYRCTISGWLLDPRLIVEAGGETHTFWMERGGRGVRYLSLPASGSVSDVRIEGRHARVVGPIRIADVGAGSVPEGPLLVVAPHPDDAEIAAYGLYRARAASTHIVVVTTGDRGNAYRTGVERPGGWTAWLRRFDGLTAPLLAGVAAERVSSLDFPEAAFGGGAGAPAVGDLQRRLEETIRRVRPATVVVPHPTLESHPVHLATTAATLRALRETGSCAEALFCLVHVPAANRYPLGPMNGAVPLPPWSDGEPQFERLVVHPLSPVVQAEKAFALDAHHDLRPPPLPFAKERRLLHIVRERLKEGITGLGRVASRDYYRRAVRPYELFLAVSADGLPEYLRRLEKG